MKPRFFLPLLASGLFLAASAGVHAQQPTKVGTVDMRRIFESYYKTKDSETRINDARASAKKELDERMDTYRKTAEEAQKLSDDLARAEGSKESQAGRARQRDVKLQDAQKMEREIREFQQTREKQLADQTARIRSGLVEEITKVVNERVKSDQFDLVLDRSGQSLNAVPVLLYARESYDFTGDVIQTLNRDKPAPTPSLAPATSDQPAAPPAKTP